MKNKITLLIVISVFNLLACNILKAQACTPDSSLATAGFTPRVLPCGEEETFYDESVYFRLPVDTTIHFPPMPPTTVAYDSFWISTVNNLPTGIMYECDITTCFYDPNPPDPIWGCIRFSGFPSDTTLDSDFLEIELVGYAVVFGFPSPIYFTVAIDLDLEPSGGCLILGQKDFAASFRFGVSPNPSSLETHIYFDLIREGNANISLLDLMGKQVKTLLNGHKSTGSHSLGLDLTSLPKGIYFVKFDFNHGEFASVEKVLVD